MGAAEACVASERILPSRIKRAPARWSIELRIGASMLVIGRKERRQDVVIIEKLSSVVRGLVDRITDVVVSGLLNEHALYSPKGIGRVRLSVR